MRQRGTVYDKLCPGCRDWKWSASCRTYLI